MRSLTLLSIALLLTQSVYADEEKAAQKDSEKKGVLETIKQGVGNIATEIYQEVIEERLLGKDDPDDEEEKDPAKELSTMSNNLKDFIEALGDPVGGAKLTLGIGEQSDKKDAEVLLDFPVLKPISFKFRTPKKADEQDYTPYLQISREDTYMRVYAHWVGNEIEASIRFFVFKEDPNAEIPRKQIRTPLRVRMYPAKGIDFLLEEITITTQGLDKEAKDIRLEVDAKIYEKGIDGNVDIEWIDIGGLSFDANFNKETKKWSGEFKVFEDAKINEFEGLSPIEIEGI